jgi:benzoyl-CoA 2,3-epoxidase subunit B
MLTEEAHHMFVGQTGIARIAQRTAEVVRQGKDPRKEGAIPFDVLQRYLNFWYTVSLDLFGSEVSTNGANYFGSGLKGRPKEGSYPDHALLEGAVRVELFEDGKLIEREVAPRLAVNLQTRQAYREDCQGAVDKWNRVAADLGVEFRLPSERFHRGVGTFAGVFFDPEGKKISEQEFRHHERDWLPSDDDEAYVRSLMTHPVTQPGKFASWIAPPARGINAQAADFEYVRFNEA